MDQTQPPLYRIEPRGGVTMVSVLRAQLDQTDVEEFARAMAPLLAARPGAGPKIIIDLAPVGYMPSRLLGVLMTLHTQARDGHGMLRLCAVQPSVMELFTLTRLASVLHLDATVADALKKMS
jgi:anti-anti-sigma factor